MAPQVLAFLKSLRSLANILVVLSIVHSNSLFCLVIELRRSRKYRGWIILLPGGTLGVRFNQKNTFTLNIHACVYCIVASHTPLSSSRPSLHLCPPSLLSLPFLPLSISSSRHYSLSHQSPYFALLSIPTIPLFSHPISFPHHLSPTHSHISPSNYLSLSRISYPHPTLDPPPPLLLRRWM
jgi:hypothetical protein